MKPYQVVTATRGTSLTSTQRLLLIQVAFRAGEGGACWAAAETLGDDVGVDERTIRRLLAQLVEAGALSRERRPGRPDVYRVTFTPGTMSDRTPCPDHTPDTMPGVSGHHVRGERAPCPATPGTMSDDQIPDQSHEQIPDQSQEPTGGTALEDAPTVEDTTACTMVVRGRVAPDPDAPTELQVAELVALQQTAMPSRADHDAVTRLLVKPGVTAEVARAMWEAAAADDWWQEATDTGEPRLRWRSLAKPGPGLDKRIGAAQEAVAELARRAWRNRAPDPAPEPRKTFDIFAKKRFETVEQHEQRVRNLRAMMAKKTADGAQK